MQDPFPIPPIPALSEAVKPWADYLGLPTLSLHVHEVLLTAVLYEFFQLVISPLLSKILFPKHYGSLSGSKRVNWDVHVVSLFQSVLISILALWVLFTDFERKSMSSAERVWGYTGASAMIQAMGTGYFLWDLWVTATNLHLFGLGMLAHAISALLVYSFGFRPFVNYYSTVFILWELSTPFLNIHWFCDKLDLTGSRIQFYNGVALVCTFFGCRLIWGTSQSFRVAQDVYHAVRNGPPDLASNPARYSETIPFELSAVPLWLAAIYLGANLTLNSLNFYWFSKMIQALRKRFEPAAENEPATKADVKSRGVTTGVDVKSDSLISRPRRGTILDGDDVDEPPPI